MKMTRTYADFARPFTLLPPALGVVSGAVTAWGAHGTRVPLLPAVLLPVLWGALMAAVLNSASNAINQIYDLEIDRVNKPKRPLPSGALTMGQAWGFTLACFVAAWALAWLAVPPGLEARRECFWIVLFTSVLVWAYSAPPLRTKRHGVWANVTIAIPRGLLLKVAGWSTVKTVLGPEPWFIGTIFGLFVLGASTTKDFADIEGDRAGGCKTLPILHGPRKAAWIIAPFFVLPWLLMPLFAHLPDPQNPAHAILTGNAWALTGLGALLTLWGCYTVYLLVRDPDELTRSENHPSWRHMYLMMMAAQIGFAVAYLIPR